MSNNFDYKEFATSMSEQALSMVPPDLTDEAGKYLVDTVKNFTYLSGEALVNDTIVSFTDDQYVLSTQIIAEWTFHKCVDLSRSSVDKKHWDSIMQKIAFAIFEITKQGMLKNIPQEQLLQAVEFHVVKAYKESLEELCERGEISDSVLEEAMELSNIDKMAAERDENAEISLEEDAELIKDEPKIKQKKKSKKVYKFDFLKKIFSKIKNCLVSILDFIKTSLETIFGMILILCNTKTLLKISVVLVVYFAYKFYALKVYEFVNQIHNISSLTLDTIVSGSLLLGLLVILFKTYVQAINADVKAQLKELEETRQKMQDLVNPNKQFERLCVDVLCLQVGAGLLCIADPDQEGDLLAKTAALRQMLTDELGYIIPEIRIMDSSAIDVNEYVISVRGNKVASGFVYPDKCMVIVDEWENKGYAIPDNALCGIDPANDAQAYWIDKEDIEDKNFITAVSPTDVIKTHLKKVVIKYVDSILTASDIGKYIVLSNEAFLRCNVDQVFNSSESEVNQSFLIKSLLSRLQVEDIRKVFVYLIREEISIKDILFVLERLCDYSRYTNNPVVLAERLRSDLKRQICLGVSDENSILYAVTLTPEIEKFLEANIQISETGNNPFLLINPTQLQYLVETTAKCLLRSHQLIGRQPVILCSSLIRLHFRRLLETTYPQISVISYTEIASNVKVKSVGVVRTNQGVGV